ncbi:PQQ-binding-like beta-propeller repeat protein [Salinigranum marinum]|uniref:outer membrane protein assembly factor BamB family protein n=1 Tax=Salinigranum marinum TaxID=1515595 RepID=UPI002989AFD8|nr:PQQ-binding-like beta-propeller repeat protein [Salinigranum marinum]
MPAPDVTDSGQVDYGPAHETYATDEIPRVEVTDEMLLEDGENEESWLHYRGGYRGHGYTPCDALDTESVADLELEYIYHIDTGGGYEDSPTIVPGDPPILYTVGGYDKMAALNARTGEVYWVFQPRFRHHTDVSMARPYSRGVAVYGDTVYLNATDTTIYALDRYTGEERWSTRLHDPTDGYFQTQKPIVYDGMLILGHSGGERGVQGEYTAVDAETGEIEYSETFILKDKWPEESWRYGAGTAWMTPVIDPETETVYWSTGNPGPDFNANVRPGPNVMTCSTVATDAHTGELKWFYQILPHDWWDRDIASPPLVATPSDGRTRVFQQGKHGWVYMFDAESGKVTERSEPYGYHTDNEFERPGFSNEEAVEDQGPSLWGGSEWSPPSWSPKTDRFYALGNFTKNDLVAAHPDYEERAQGSYGYLDGFVGGGLKNDVLPTNEGGEVVAYDPETGARDWTHETPEIIMSGSLVTGGNVLVVGLPTSEIRFIDAETGDLLRREREPDAPVCAAPTSWYDPGTEKQYLAVAAGGGGDVARYKYPSRPGHLLVYSVDA